MDTKELSSSLGTAVSKLYKSLRRKNDSIKNYSLTEVETIMHLFRSSPQLPTELAAVVKITTQSMSQILKKMEGQGIIKRIPSKDDKRKVYISLTPLGKKMVEQVRYDTHEWLRGAIEKQLTDKEMEIITKAIPILNKLI
ncbi:MAG TPA: MarR family transcriptional regulator [Bacteroidia bacterium]|jgi:DNA-binding MarR family transcriptional regulator|nr:MarR family transcriptional regulator [Bacteroidia bacterium]